MSIPQNIITIEPSVLFSICTFVTNFAEYNEMVDSFKIAGFESNTEYIYIDNSNGNSFDGYLGMSHFLSKAHGKYIIVCHQDVLAIDRYSILLQCIADIETVTKKWAILGNAGAIRIKKMVSYYINGRNEFFNHGTHPAKVISLDENFLVFNRTACCGVSDDLKGFHFYGTDACILAKMRGYGCFVIPYLIKHKSFGTTNKDYFKQKVNFISQYNRKLKSKFLETTCTKLYISGSNFKMRFFNSKLIMIFVRLYFKLRK